MRATYPGSDGVARTLTGEASADSSLCDDTRLVASAASFGLMLLTPLGMALMTLDSTGVGFADDRGGYAADLRYLAQLAQRIRR